jgi:hypothetical protein
MPHLRGVKTPQLRCCGSPDDGRRHRSLDGSITTRTGTRMAIARPSAKADRRDSVRQVDQDDIREFAQPIEDDLLAIGRDVERARGCIAWQACELSGLFR